MKVDLYNPCIYLTSILTSALTSTSEVKIFEAISLKFGMEVGLDNP